MRTMVSASSPSVHGSATKDLIAKGKVFPPFPIEKESAFALYRG